MRTPINSRRPAVVRVAVNAYFDMLYAAAESAVVPPDLTEDSLNTLTVWDRSRKGKRVHASPLPPTLVFSRTGLETTGILVGRDEVGEDRTVYSVERMFPVTALRTDSSVGHSCRSPELLNELATALGAPWEVIGGFHSHPLMDVEVAEIEGEQRFGPSPGDLHRPPFFWGHAMDLIVTITKVGDAKPTRPTRPGPCFQRRVGEFEFWIFAHAGIGTTVILDVETAPKFADRPPNRWRRRPPPPF